MPLAGLERNSIFWQKKKMLCLPSPWSFSTPGPSGGALRKRRMQHSNSARWQARPLDVTEIRGASGDDDATTNSQLGDDH